MPTTEPTQPEFDTKISDAGTPQTPQTQYDQYQLPGSTMEQAGGLLSAQYRPATEGPTTRNVQEQDTASGQMSRIMDKQSDLMRDAQARAKGDMASRGLLNTSMTAGEVQRGMMDAAMDLAKHDASTYLKQGLQNQDVMNMFSRDRNALAQDLAAGQFEADIGEFAKDAALRRDISLDIAKTGNQIKIDSARAMDRLRESLQDYKESLGKAEYDAWVASGAEEALQKSGLDGKYIDAYTKVMISDDMTNSEKQIRLEELDAMFSDLYEAIGYDFNYMQDYSTGYLAVSDAVMSV